MFTRPNRQDRNTNPMLAFANCIKNTDCLLNAYQFRLHCKLRINLNFWRTSQFENVCFSKALLLSPHVFFNWGTGLYETSMNSARKMSVSLSIRMFKRIKNSSSCKSMQSFRKETENRSQINAADLDEKVSSIPLRPL